MNHTHTPKKIYQFDWIDDL